MAAWHYVCITCVYAGNVASQHKVVKMANAPVVPGTLPARVALYNKRITILVSACPKLPGTKAAARWALYTNGMSVAAFLQAAKAAGHTHPASDIRYNVAHGFISVE